MVSGVSAAAYYFAAPAYETDVLGLINASPAGSGSWAGNPPEAAAYVAGSYERVFISTWDLNYGNFGTGIGSARFTCSMGCSQA